MSRPEYPDLIDIERVWALAEAWVSRQIDQQARELRHALRIIPAYFGSNLNREWQGCFEAAAELLRLTLMKLEIVHNRDYRLVECLEREDK